MPPPSNILSLARSMPLRSRRLPQWRIQPAIRAAPSSIRTFSDAKDPPPADRSKRADTQPLPHVSEEAAKIAEIKGEEGPQMEQGTPVEEVVKGDKAAVESLPKVMQDEIKGKQSSSAPKGTRSYSTTTTPTTSGGGGFDLGLVGFAPPTAVPSVPGIKFDLPSLPLPKGSHLKHRYEPVVDQVTNMLMRHGRKSVAQRNMAIILEHLRTSPIPTVNPSRPLLPGAPPPSHLPLNPVLYLTLAIDSVAPLFRIKSLKGAAGGGFSLQVPVPLGLRQRRRTALEWILGSASKKKNMGNGKSGFAQRVAAELVSVVEGKSSVWERRNALHKQGVAARANLALQGKKLPSSKKL